MTNSVIHLAVYDTLADWETGYVTAHINKPTWHKTPGRFSVRTVGPSTDAVTTMGGMRVTPDETIAALRPEDSAMLILPGNDLFADEAFQPFAAKAKEFLAAGVPVAAICGATGGLALAGVFDDRAHTSNAKAFLDGLGYRGGDNYRDEPVVVDRGLITAGASAPVELAKAIFDELEVFTPEASASWYKYYGDQDPAGFYELMGA